MIFARKMPEFYIIARKIFLPNFRGGARAPTPAPRLRRPCLKRTGSNKTEVLKLASLMDVTTRMMNQTSWQVRPMNAGLRNLAIAT